MQTHPFNTFLGALQSAVGQAQGAAATQHRDLVERMVEMGPDGEPMSRSWSVHVPAALRRAKRVDTLVLPLLTLRRLMMPQLTGLTLEVGVEVKTERKRFPSGFQKVTLVIPKDTPSSKQELRRLSVTLTGPQPGVCEVAIDGAMLKRLDRPAPESPAPAPLSPMRARLQRILEFFGFFRRFMPLRRKGIRLGLSEEDAQRVALLVERTESK